MKLTTSDFYVEIKTKSEEARLKLEQEIKDSVEYRKEIDLIDKEMREASEKGEVFYIHHVNHLEHYADVKEFIKCIQKHYKEQGFDVTSIDSQKSITILIEIRWN